jgi:hypothetical protein
MFEPCEINQELTESRIDSVGRLLVEAHHEVLSKEEAFDTGWSTGCRSHTWRSSKIMQTIGVEGFEWLKIIDPSLKFIFSIGGVPVNMFKGATDKPKKNILSRANSYPELKQMGLLTDLECVPSLVWSYAMETGPAGEVVSIQFVGLTESGEVVAQRNIPIDGMQTPVTGVATEDFEPVSLPAPSLSLRKTPRQDQESESSRNRKSPDAEGK